MIDLESAMIDVNGVKTHFLQAGAGEPVLLLHGSGPGVTAETNWSQTIPSLARDYLVLAPEMVGFGSTERASGLEYRMSTWVEHVLGFLDVLGIDSVRVVGNSLGGAVSLYAAAAHPDRFSRLVLMGSPGVGMQMTEGLQALRRYEPVEQGMRDLLRTHFAYDPDIVTDDMIRRRYEASARPGESENYRAIHRGQASRDNRPMDEQLVRSIDTPTLLVHGLDDHVISPEVSWTMAGLLPRADLHLFARCGHWAQIERAFDFNDLVAA